MRTELIVTVLPGKKKSDTNLVLSSSAGMICAFASWQTLFRMMQNDDTAERLVERVSVRVAERLELR